MNVFYTSPDPFECAKNHCTVHTRKMIVEYAQLLSTAHHVLDGENAIEGIYKESHTNHPCAVWVRESIHNYLWLVSLTVDLLVIYARATGRQHKTASLFPALSEPPRGLPIIPFTEPPQCMPDEFKQEDTCQAYKDYLKFKYNDWQSRDRPIQVKFYYPIKTYRRV